MKIVDDFSDETLNNNWMFLRTPKTQWYDLEKSRDSYQCN